MIRLSEAVERFRREEYGQAPSYQWHRRAARRFGSVRIGGVVVPAVKSGGVWRVAEADLSEAISRHREDVWYRLAVTADYDRRVLHGGPGDTVRTTWGQYVVGSGFHRSRAGAGPGPWQCSGCWDIATPHPGRERCRVCAAQDTCSKGCPPARLSCAACGTSMSLSSGHAGNSSTGRVR